MDFVLLGTGCPQCDPDRLGPSNLVRHAGRAFLLSGRPVRAAYDFGTEVKVKAAICALLLRQPAMS